MLPAPPLAHHAALIARLGSGLPPELDRLALPHALGLPASSAGVTFRFVWRDVPFSSAVEGRGEEALLKLSGTLGPMPFTVEAGRRRRRALRTLAAACHATALDWRVTPTQEIVVAGEARLPRPLSPAAMIAGAVGLVLRADSYLTLLLDVLGDAACLNLPAAA